MAKPVAPELLERTKAAGLKLTPARKAILSALSGSHRLVTIDELARSLKGKGGDWSTVFRCMKKFEEAGLVSAVAFADGLARYELTDDHGHGHHHHHAICTECKTATPIAACSIGKLEASVAAMGFTSLTHRLEFFGICAGCSA